jgi:hypothetical protein
MTGSTGTTCRGGDGGGVTLLEICHFPRPWAGAVADLRVVSGHLSAPPRLPVELHDLRGDE